MLKIILLINIFAIIYVHSRSTAISKAISPLTNIGENSDNREPRQASLNNWYDSKIYTFAFPGIQPGSFFNGTHLDGPRVELMKEVCCKANKRCDAALVDFIRCWNDNNQSDVLNGRWYDVCAQLSTIRRREVSYAFSEISFLSVPNPAVVVRKTSNVTLDDLKNPRNELKLALMSVPELGTAGVLNVFRDFFFVQPDNVISLKRGAGNDVTSEILRLINDPCSGIDLGIVVTALARKDDPFKILFELPVDLGESTLMVRKDDQHILEWWDYALRKFMCSKEYKKFCKRMDKRFGTDPLNCPDPKQVNCAHDCEIKMRVPVCNGCNKDEDGNKKDEDETTSTTEVPTTTSSSPTKQTPATITTEATTSETTTSPETTSAEQTSTSKEPETTTSTTTSTITTSTTTTATTEPITTEPRVTEEDLNKTTLSVTQSPTATSSTTTVASSSEAAPKTTKHYSLAPDFQPSMPTIGVTGVTSEAEITSNQSSTEITTSSIDLEGTKGVESGSTSDEDQSGSGGRDKIVSVVTATASQEVTDYDSESHEHSVSIPPGAGKRK